MHSRHQHTNLERTPPQRARSTEDSHGGSGRTAIQLCAATTWWPCTGPRASWQRCKLCQCVHLDSSGPQKVSKGRTTPLPALSLCRSLPGAVRARRHECESMCCKRARTLLHMTNVQSILSVYIRIELARQHHAQVADPTQAWTVYGQRVLSESVASWARPPACLQTGLAALCRTANIRVYRCSSVHVCKALDKATSQALFGGASTMPVHASLALAQLHRHR